jgi:hypothetical protein
MNEVRNTREGSEVYVKGFGQNALSKNINLQYVKYSIRHLC